MDFPLPVTVAPEEALKRAIQGVEAGLVVAVATVIERRGSSPATPGQKLAVVRADDGHLDAFGTVGGGAVERAVMTVMEEGIRLGADPRIHQFQLGPNLGMCCGGSVTVLVETLQPPWTVLLVGAGHVGLATAKLLPSLGFKTVLVDDRDEANDAERATDPSFRFFQATHDDAAVLEALGPLRDRTLLAVMTHDHQLDQTVLEWGLSRRFTFVGGVGSRAKAARLRARLEAKSFDPRDIERVRMPIGVDIGARRPAEIAVAIAAELVSERAAREKLARSHSPHSRSRVEAAE